MRLLFVTQVLDGGDAVLGFVLRWVQGLAGRVERLRVIALAAGDLAGLPPNVELRVLGRRGSLRRWLRYRSFLAEAFGRDGFDTLLTHMVPRYSTLAEGLARRHGAGHFLWYTHKAVDARLLAAVKSVDAVFTASPESMRAPCAAKVVTGHGIDLAHFPPAPQVEGAPLLLSVGRLSPSKDPSTVLEALARLRERGVDARLEWAGGGLVESDADTERAVRAAVERLGLAGTVRLLGAVPYRDVPALYARAALFVSASRTGSVDKVVLEAMASERVVVTCNEAFPPLFAELGAEAEHLSFPAGDAGALAERLAWHLARPLAERARLGARLRAIVARDHEVEGLMARLVAEMQARRGDRFARARGARTAGGRGSA